MHASFTKLPDRFQTNFILFQNMVLVFANNFEASFIMGSTGPKISLLYEAHHTTYHVSQIQLNILKKNS